MARTTQTRAGKGQTPKCRCEWKGCSGTPHETQVTYNDKKKGCVKRGDYVGNWPPPYCMQTKSYTDFGVTEGSFKGLESTSYPDVQYSERNFYTTEYHHVIPISAMETMGKTRDNLKILGWNINDGISNGMRLPYFKEDHIWHYLQPHRSKHPNRYKEDVKMALRKIEKKCGEFCQLSEKEQTDTAQETLIIQIAKTVDTIRNRILNWTLKIHLPDTISKWTAIVFSKNIATKTRGYFRDDGKVSSKPPQPRKPHKARKYIE